MPNQSLELDQILRLWIAVVLLGDLGQASQYPSC